MNKRGVFFKTSELKTSSSPEAPHLLSPFPNQKIIKSQSTAPFIVLLVMTLYYLYPFIFILVAGEELICVLVSVFE